MLIGNKNYSSHLNLLEKEEENLCNQLMQMFFDCKIEHLNIGCVGNSISSGYSKCDEMIPFFTRSKLYQYSQNIDFYSFARVRRNEEKNVLRWYSKNISHLNINKLLLDDLRAKEGRYANYGSKQKKEYEKIMNASDIGFKDYIKLENNIVIYSGLSGTFTDIFRKGNFKDRKSILQSFCKDFEYLKMLLTQIYIDNPFIQVYICGLPDVLGVGLTNLFDGYIKRALRIVPNAVYVKGVTRNILTRMKDQKELDYHYNKPEYLSLLCEIWGSILNNYVSIAFKNEVLFGLSKYSDEVECKDTTGKGEFGEIKNIIKRCESKYSECFEKYSVDVKRTKKEIWKYYDNNYLADYGCTDRSAVKAILEA